jgi:hypothetical protein
MNEVGGYHEFPSPLWGGIKGGGREVSPICVERMLRGFPTPTPNPSPQGGGEWDP